MQPDQDRKIYRRDYTQGPNRPPAEPTPVHQPPAPAQPSAPAPIEYLAPAPQVPSSELHVEPGYQMPTPVIADQKTAGRKPGLKLPGRRVALIAAAVVLVAAGLFSAQKLFLHKSSGRASGVSVNGQATDASAEVNAGLPKINTSDYKYDSQNKIATYTDKIGVVALAVTEQTQALATKAALSTSLIKSSADDLGSSTPLVVNNGAAFEVLTNGGKAQSAVFASGRQLVTVKSNFIIGSAFWQQFINGFKAKSPGN